MPITDFTATYSGGSSFIDTVRAWIMDVDVETTPPDVGTARTDWSCLFIDSEILAAAAQPQCMGNAAYTAASLLDRIAANTALLAHRLKIGPYEEDTKGVAKELREQANQLRHMADTIPAENITNVPWTDANWSRIALLPQGG